MRVDVSQSQFHEAPTARQDFTKPELKRCRLLLRRLRFLEAQVRENGGLAAGDASGGAAFAEWEVEALEWILTDVGFLQDEHKESA
jgi:hypothetical protein